MQYIAPILRICGGSAAFLFAKGWGFYPPSYINSDTKAVFSHAYMQAIMIFLGEVLTGFVPLIDKNGKKGRFPLRQFWRCILPAIFDSFAQTYSNLGIGNELISVQQILRLSAIVFTALFNAIDEKYRNNFKQNQQVKIMSLVLIFAACLIISGASEGLTRNKMPDCGNPIQSAWYVLISGVFSAFYSLSTSLYQEFHDVHPLKVYCCEGICGIIVYIIALPFLSGLQLEKPGDWVYQHRTGYVIGNQICFLISVFCVTCGGYFCGKHVSPHAFQITEAARPTLVMIISWACKFETFDPSFTLITIIVQALMVLGHYMYCVEQPKKPGMVNTVI